VLVAVAVSVVAVVAAVAVVAVVAAVAAVVEVVVEAIELVANRNKIPLIFKKGLPCMYSCRAFMIEKT
jgi:hypothetical protein